MNPPRNEVEDILPPKKMGAAQSVPHGADRGVPHAYNNQEAVASLLMHHRKLASGHDLPAKCPISHDKTSLTKGDALNPLNYMPELTQSQAPLQKIELSKERTISSIPRAPNSAAPGAAPYDSPAQCPIPHETRTEQASACPVQHDSGDAQPSNWEYPSPQQFYNALVRKGWETPEEHVEMMVLIHNFLNERAWQEVIEWEKLAGSDVSRLQLARFQGRPGTLSPRARMFGWLAWAMPSRFSSEPPFDRHDWIVYRPPANGSSEGEEVRYIIDYYSEPEETEDDDPSFNLDVRPALDSFSAIRTRWKKTLQEYESGELFAPFRSPEPAAREPDAPDASDAPAKAASAK